MIDKTLGYHKETQELIERMCRNVERQDFVLDKKNAEECLLKTYDLFGLLRPNNVVWAVDIFDEGFSSSASSAWSSSSDWSASSASSASSAWSARSDWLASSAWSARSARLASSASSAWSASSASSAWSASSASSAWSASSARLSSSARLASSARSARLASSASSAWSARSDWLASSAIDYDFDWFVFAFEHKLENSKDINDSDRKYLEYSELLMKAKEYGAGYRVEFEETLYIAPVPIVRLDEQKNYHSINEASIRWEGGNEFFHLWGVSLEKDLWSSITKKTITPKEVLAIDNVEQRMVAIKFYGMEQFLEDLGAKLLDKSLSETKVLVDNEGIIYEVLDPNYDTSHLTVEKRLRVNELYQVDNFFTQFPRAYFLKFTCPSTGRVYCEGVDPEIAEKYKNADKCMEAMLGVDDYSKLTVES